MPQPIGPDYHIHIKLVSDPALTPDGALVAFTLRWFDSGTIKPRSEIFVIDLGASGPSKGAQPAQPRQLTHESDSEMPAWSPDGRTVAMLRPDNHSRRQVWTISAAGGEAKQLTDEPGGVDALAWSPDGTRIAFRADVAPDLPEPGRDLEKDPLISVARRLRYREDGFGWRGDRFRHIFIADVRSRAVKQITFGEGNDGAPVWSPDGMSIAFISDFNPFREITARTDVNVIPAAGGPPDRRSGGLFMSGSIAWSPYH